MICQSFIPFKNLVVLAYRLSKKAYNTTFVGVVSPCTITRSNRGMLRCR